MEVKACWVGTADVNLYMLGLLGGNGSNIFCLPFLNRGLLNVDNLSDCLSQKDLLTLSDSLAKNNEPFPIPRVPFFFLPFLSISDTDQVLMSSAVTLVEATLSAGSTYAGFGGCSRFSLDNREKNI